MTMDVATNLDPQIAAALAVSPIGVDRLRHVHLRVAPGDAPGDGRHARGRAAADHHRRRTRSSCPARPATTRRCACTRRPPTATGRPCVYWIHGGGYMFGSGLNDRRPAQPLGRGVRLRRGVDRVPPRPRRPVPRTARRLLRGPALDRAARRRAGHRPGPHRDRRCERRAWASRRVLPSCARDRGEVDVAFQLLIYPMIDDREHDARRATSRARRCGAGRPTTWAGAPIWASSSARTTSRPTRCRRGSRAWRASRRRGSAWASLDVFRDEDIEYASRMLAAGIPVELHVYPGAPHGFEMIVPHSAIAQACRARHHGGAATGAASGVRLRVHRLTTRVNPLTSNTIPAASKYVDGSTWRERWISGGSAGRARLRHHRDHRPAHLVARRALGRGTRAAPPCGGRR